jgi:hypothetical protein
MLVAILFSLLVGGIAISNQSLWIDEAWSAAKAMQPSLGSWWATMASDKGSDLQMPFYMLYLWAWAKAFGASEIALRASNLPWFAAGVLALLWGFPQQRRFQFSIALLTLTHAFLWYYISEALPYIVLFAFSSLTAACLFRLQQSVAISTDSNSWFRWFCLGVAGICATNLIAVPWAVTAIGAFVFWTGPRHALRMATRSAWFFGLIVTALIGLGIYYVWTLRLGNRASHGRSGFATIGFGFYELLGISGLGPGRLTLREEGMRTLIAYAPAVSVGVISVFTLCAPAVTELRKRATRRDCIFFGIAIVLPLIAVMLAGGAAHMRLLGRHFTPLLPFLLAFLGFGLAQLLFASRGWIRAVAVAAIVTLLISALEIRFAPRHQRDDYRTAAGEARRAIADGEKVWWAADVSTGAYYGIPLNSPDLTLGSNLSDRFFETLPTPDLVCLSKPDIYDPNDKIRNYLRAHDFKVMRVLPAFQIFQRQPDRH